MSSDGTGALPGLDDEGAEALDVPQGTSKRKSNARLGVVVLAAILAVAFVFGGAVLFMKHRRAKAAEAQALAGGPVVSVDPTKQKNAAVESKSIEALKAEIRRNEAEGEESPGSDAYKAAALKAAGSGRPSGAPGAVGQGRPMPGGASDAGELGADPSSVRVMSRSERQLADSLMPGGQAPAKAEKAGAVGALARPGYGQEEDPALRQQKALLQAALGAQQGQSLPAPALPFGSRIVGEADAAIAPKGTGVESQLTPTTLASVKAGRLGNLDFLLKKDTVISCALKTGVDTTHPSFPVCQVTNDVYSANGRTLLVERGATVHGEARAKMDQGQGTVFILWNRIDNPSGTYANLDSPGADQMGYGGVEAEVNTHFWSRYGGALLLSMVSDGLAAAIARQQGNGTGGSTVQIGNTTGTTKDMASEALKNSINIPPTGRVKPGKVISIIVARDVSFDSLFKIVQ